VFLAMIRAIEARTLVIQGGSDHIVSPGAVEWMCSLHPEWDRLQLEATGHTPQVDAPLRFVRAVGGWLASTAMDATLV
jgi:pimeloyl-ACP methyl ester carboxylesterase